MPDPKKKKHEYIIIDDVYRTRFEKRVADHLDLGWELAGGVSICRSSESNRIVMAQTLHRVTRV